MTSDSSAQAHAVQNARGILAMLFSTASFIFNDTLMKLAAARMPVGEAIFLRGLLASVLVVCAAYAMGAMRNWRAALSPVMLWRTFGELGGTLLYLSALIRMPIANATAILQVVPLAITAASAVFMAEQVGWRRWTATLIGLIGAILIVQPGPDGFNFASFFAFGAIGFIVLRDLLTRKLDRGIPALFITVITSVSVTILGLLLAPFENWVVPTFDELVLMLGSSTFLVGGYLAIVTAMRAGEVSVVSPFRYALILWAMLTGYLFWGDVPQPLMLAGIAIVVCAGIYTFHREARLKIRRKSYIRA